MNTSARLFTRLILLIPFLVVSLSACKPEPTTPEIAAHAEGTVVSLQEPSETAAPLLSTPTLIPTTSSGSVATSENLAASGLIILAEKIGGFVQLAAYHPLNQALTQITDDEWDHADPAISPDGTKLAFCADEFGRWDIFILDLLTGEKTHLTNTTTYACSPTWSPDGRWVAYEEVMDEKLNLVIRSVMDESVAPHRLTDNGGNNFDPAWSPSGREIAFVTDRNGRLELWLANLDNPQQRFNLVARSEHADYTHPVWSGDGHSLAWVRTDEFEEIETWNLESEQTRPVTLGSGSHPVWMDEEQGVLAVVHSANSNDLVAYSTEANLLLLPPIHQKNEVLSISWVPAKSAPPLKKYLSQHSAASETRLWQPEISTQDVSSGRYEMVYLPDVTAPEPFLIDTVNESFNSMRAALRSELGWDFLKILEGASISIPAYSSPGLLEDWGYTGRSIAVNLDPLDSGWMAVSREDILGRTYWRVWLKCMQQDGTCGVPIQNLVWDFNARIQGSPSAYENGGLATTLPQGYWIDFTSFALGYGWERLPAGSNWQVYFPETRINRFVLRDGLTWHEAMRQRFTDTTIESYWSFP